VALCPDFTSACARDFSKTPSVESAVKKYPTPFRAGEGEDGEEEEWHPKTVTTLPVQVGSPTATS